MPEPTSSQQPARHSGSPTPSSYLASGLEGRFCDDKGGRQVIASRPIRKGESLVVWGGEVLTGKQLGELPRSEYRLCLQVEEDLYLYSTKEGPADWVNHSCEPNCGLQGQIVLVALQDIEPGEEICFDYAMADSSSYDEFECQCGSSHCRGRVTGEDWRRPSLQRRYRGNFSPYLQRRIEREDSGT